MIKFNFSREPVFIACGEARLAGTLELPPHPHCMVILTRDENSRRLAPCGNYLAEELRRAGLALLLLDVSGSEDDGGDKRRTDIARLGARLAAAADWLTAEPDTRKLALGLFGTGCGAAAAVRLAASRPDQIAALVSCGGRPDLAGAETLARVRAPALLIVGEEDHAVCQLNREALDHLGGEKDLALVRGATHPGTQPHTLQEAARLATRWFNGYLGGSAHRVP